VCLNCRRSRRHVCAWDGEHANNPALAAASTSVPAAPLDEQARVTRTDGSHGTYSLAVPLVPEVPQPLSCIFGPDYDSYNDTTSWSNSFDYVDNGLYRPRPTPSSFAFDGSNYSDAFGAFVSRTESAPMARLPPTSVRATIQTRSMESLLEHWRSYICPLMIPTSAPAKNPYLQIYLPMALSESHTDAKRCLLLAMLAVAAYSRAELSSSDKVDLRRQAIELRDEAASTLKALAADLQSTMGHETDREALLAATLAMTTIEVFSGDDKGAAYEHLLLAKRIIHLLGGPVWWMQTPSRTTLMQIFDCHEIVARTSGWRHFREQQLIGAVDTSAESTTLGGISASMLPDDIVDAMDFGPSSLDFDYSLDISFGVSRRSLRCLHGIYKFSALKASMPDGQVWPTAQSERLSRLETDVFDALDDPSLLEFPTGLESSPRDGLSGFVGEELLQNHVLAFHYAVALFYKRAIAHSIQTSTARYKGQELVDKTLEHLENIDAIAAGCALADTLWPAFIAAAEAVNTPLRHRALIWFARARRHGIGNIAKAKQLVLEVWRRVDRQSWVTPQRRAGAVLDLGPIDWREVMEEKGMYIMLT
jgi:hypothetical protein